jgi:CheY-like chemotaxis protein
MIKTIPRPLPFVVARADQARANLLLRLSLMRTNESRGPWSNAAGQFTPEPDAAAPARGSVDSPSIYAVDDTAGLTDLYKAVLEPEGYSVKTFHLRARALTALAAADKCPDLLISDFIGLSMPAHQFIQASRAIYPGLRILMASGLSPSSMHFARGKPDWFLHKPFTPDQLLRAVKLALAAG